MQATICTRVSIEPCKTLSGVKVEERDSFVSTAGSSIQAGGVQGHL